MITVIGLLIVAGIAIPFLLLKFVVRVLLWLKRRRGPTPYVRARARAVEGAFLLTACIYAATWFPLLLGRGLPDLAQDLWRSPSDYPGVGVWFGVVALSVMWVGTGLRGARGGDRDWMSAWWSAAVGGGCLALLWWHWFPSPDRSFATLLQIAVVKGFYIAIAAASLVRLWLTLPLFGNAMNIVARHIRAQAVVWRSARRS